MVLYINRVLDEDGDTIPAAADFCPGTVVPESVPTIRLLPFRWALVDEDPIFDTRPLHGYLPTLGFTLEDTGGCSCEQIIDELDLFFINDLFGYNSFSMYRWIQIVESSSP